MGRSILAESPSRYHLHNIFIFNFTMVLIEQFKRMLQSIIAEYEWNGLYSVLHLQICTISLVALIPFQENESG